CKTVRARRASWRVLKGTVTDAAPSSGITRVEVSAITRHGKRCSALRKDGFAKVSCKAKLRYFAATVTGGTWKITLRKLPRGTIRIRARARDAAGNLQRKPAIRTLHLTR
ncbi:MAG: hypothetical protein QOG68_90, partial [Solirubrobacteraceae bacterium]|nr:hypothetical protein [Solirubrobacteraceae bacterium]